MHFLIDFQVLYSGGEGGSGIDFKVTSAFIELYAWRTKTLTPTETITKTLSPLHISPSDLTITFHQTYQADDVLIKTWVRLSGPYVMEGEICYLAF